MASTVNVVSDEKFPEIYSSDKILAQLLNDGRTIVNKRTKLYAYALGIHSYSSGIHRIRLRIDTGYAFLGIRPRSIPPIPDNMIYNCSCTNPATYGWMGSFLRIMNGNRCDYRSGYVNRSGHVYAITLNCDEHQLSIVNENTKEQDDMDVDINCAPFPWCLFVELSYRTGQVSLV